MTNSNLSPVISANLDFSDQGIRHGFYTREGGVSEGIYKGLNVGTGSDDNQQHVTENRKKIANHLGQGDQDILTVWQHHSPDALVVETHWNSERPKADAVVTNTPGLPIGVLTADCGPVLFCDPQNRVIGAAHSGWRGALFGVLENTIDRMIELGADISSIRATLGPTISIRNYEVGGDFAENLIKQDSRCENYLSQSKNEGHAMFDLPGYITMRLQNKGAKAENLDICTYEDEKRFFSYRRKTHRNEPDYGRQLSAIALDKL